jgi:hypothetical protein
VQAATFRALDADLGAWTAVAITVAVIVAVAVVVFLV